MTAYPINRNHTRAYNKDPCLGRSNTDARKTKSRKTTFAVIRIAVVGTVPTQPCTPTSRTNITELHRYQIPNMLDRND
jgi:hypothetical protein